jgi:hypothetical protein
MCRVEARDKATRWAQSEDGSSSRTDGEYRTNGYEEAPGYRNSSKKTIESRGRMVGYSEEETVTVAATYEDAEGAG